MYFFISNNYYIYLKRYFEIFVTSDFKYILEDSCFNKVKSRVIVVQRPMLDMVGVKQTPAKRGLGLGY